MSIPTRQLCNNYFTAVFFTHPQDQAANVNDNVTFTCEASDDNIDYTWTFNDSDLMNDPGHIKGANTNILMIIGVSVADGGEYSCRADYNDIIIIPSITSDSALLYGEV